MKFADRLYNYFQAKKIPMIGVYILSNDIYFSTLFLKKLTIENAYYHKIYKHIDECLLELRTNNSLKNTLPFLIIDNSIFEEISSTTNKDAYVDLVQTYVPNMYIIQMESIEMQNFEKAQNNLIISKNDNSHKRIEQIIFTVCNDFSIQQQKKYNKILFILLTSIITSIISFLIIYSIQNL